VRPMKKKKHSKLTIRTLRSPYQTKKNDTFKDRIQKYIDDPEHIVSIDHRIFYKIMELTELRIEGRSFSMLAHVDRKLNLRIGDILIDENLQTFTFAGYAMMNYVHDQYPECLQVNDLLLEGDPLTIGEYLALYRRPSEEGE